MTTPIFDEQRAYGVLKKLSFPRLGGTNGEKSAAALLTHYLQKYGLIPEEERFRVHTFQNGRASLSVLKPYHKKYRVLPYGNGGSTPPNGLTAEIAEITSLEPSALKKHKNKIGLFYGSLTYKTYRELKKSKIKVLARVTNSPASLLPQWEWSDSLVSACGKIPAVVMSYDDGVELVQRRARLVNIRIKQQEFRGISRNVITAIPGRIYPEQKIIVCAHYDSVNQSTGTVDNASGSATILELARYFKNHPPARTLVFIWFGSEELGLCGSQAYVKRHRADFKQVKFLVNIDVTGLIVGSDGAAICGSKRLTNFVKKLAKKNNLNAHVEHHAYSSDNIYFNACGIPSVSFYRGGTPYGHTHRDTVKLTSPRHLKITGQLALDFLTRAANAGNIPFDLKIPKADKKSTAKYIKERNPLWH